MTIVETTLVYWLDPWVWDKELRLEPLPLTPQPVREWLVLVSQQGWKVVVLPYDGRIVGGPCDGGHVVAVETGEGRQYVALPPAAIPALRGYLRRKDFQALLRATPALSAPHMHIAPREGRTP
jgi:hypothetical protein